MSYKSRSKSTYLPISKNLKFDARLACTKRLNNKVYKRKATCQIEDLEKMKQNEVHALNMI